MPHTIHFKRPLRAAGFAFTLFAGTLLGACGGGDNHDGGGGAADVGTADLSAGGAKAQVGTFAQMIQALGALDALQPPAAEAAARARPLAKAARVPAKASEACPDGGTITSSGPTSKNVGSPFTNQAMSVSGAQASDCRYHETYSEDGTDVDLTLLVNGSTEGGSVEDGGQYVEYARVGSSAQPFRFDYRIKTDSTQQGYSVSADLDLGIGVDYRDDYREGASDNEDRFALAMDGDYTARASANGQSGSNSGDFTYYIGTHDAPFTAKSDADGTVIAGQYGFRMTGVQAQTCPSGAVDVATETPLVDSDGQIASPFAGGKLTFASGGKTAKVTFNADGTVTVDGSDGQSETFDYAQALAAAAPCAGYGLAGLYLAAGLGAR
ncbi:hypothetical protein [Solimonas variicoloris]|uniref:hypothetical protein n=1 Tax=Solimonas variicoloris TaxID=254408 RepID=UPI00036BF4F3|nr:hypothetical protein [Solimonas variicoloris]